MLDDKVIIVTGAAAGIGRATAEVAAKAGAHICLLDRDVATGQSVADAIPGATFVACDVSDEEQIEAAVAAVVARFGRLDVLVNNAGIGSFGRVTDIDLAHWREVMAIDVDGVFIASRAAMPHLAASKGSIVNVASISGMLGDHSFAAYNAAKAAVINLTRSPSSPPPMRPM